MLIYAISDTHMTHNVMQELAVVPDVIIHAGDACIYGDKTELANFLAWLGGIEANHRIFVPGNHDMYLDTKEGDAWVREMCDKLKITYLLGETVTINGLNIYGGPWVPKYGEYAFMRGDDYRQDLWEMIPDNTHMLITHCPARGQLDGLPFRSMFGDGVNNVGCVPLRERIKALKELKTHIFGHIHLHGGKKEVFEGVNYYNVAALNPTNERKLVLDNIKWNEIEI